MRRWVLIIFIFISSFALFSQSGRSENPYPRIKNVIIIVVDTFAAENLRFMGYQRDTSPFLDELASRSVVFTRAYTPKSTTEPAIVSLLSGLHPATHGIVDNGIRFPKDIHFLTEDFSRSGFQTWGIPSADVIDGRYGFRDRFDFYAHVPPVPLTASRVIEKITGMLEDNPRPCEPGYSISGPPLFLMLHFYDTHTDYTPDEEILSGFADSEYSGIVDGTWEQFRKYNQHEIEYDVSDLRHVRDLYDAEIRTFDDRLRELFDLFNRVGLLDNSVIVLTADHGENLGEHHFITHGNPYENSLHIPLLFHFPDDLWAGKRIESLVETTDIVPTLMRISGLAIPDGLDGQPLLTLIDPNINGPRIDNGYREREFLFTLGQAPDLTGEAQSGSPEDGFNERTYSIFNGVYRLTAEFDGDGSLCQTNDIGLYDIKIDHNESINLVDTNPPDLQTLSVQLGQMVRTSHQDSPSEMDPETIQMLKSLGYIE
jgi:arylsulfatase